MGITNTPEFAHDINSSNKIFGTTRNPWNVNVTAGGSSGGAGASIAAAMAPLAIGTDLGGSIRIPCSFNNLVGLRPTPGRIPFYPTDYGWDTLVEHVQGPMVRSISDIGLAMHVLSGPDERDPSSLPNDGKFANRYWDAYLEDITLAQEDVFHVSGTESGLEGYPKSKIKITGAN